MNPVVFAVDDLIIPVENVFRGLERFTRLASRELYWQCDVRKQRRLLAGVASTFFMAGYPLTAQMFTPAGAPAQNWVSMSSSADGTHLAAVGWYGYVYLSGDSGASWTMAPTVAEGPEPQSPWQAVASSADGSRLVAVASNCPIFTSADYGLTWSINGPTADWAAVASSADGTKLVAVDNNVGRIYTSTDSGRSWVRTSAPAKRWRCVASSADGMSLVAGTDFGPEPGDLPAIYTSADSGATWRATTAPNEPWQTLTSSADGTILAAGVYGGVIYISTDSGTNWAPAAVPQLHWSSICSSAHGNKLAAAAWEGQIYLSQDTGHTWAPAAAPAGQWQTVVCTFDGSKSFAGIWNTWDDQPTGIYTAQTLSPVRSIIAPVLNIKFIGNNAVVSWPASMTGFQLQQNSAIDAPNWTDVSASPELSDGNNQVVVPSEPGNHFFRLIHR